ncbi:hypothetical protein ABK905_22860 [Acerihabitans sp. KWT182]|uniref:Big-1 domain-containing protein n=1 Tax=Acerihabitans sp. KWT182 TaxID=3157919 RepID=A0AAU7Q847_9GAMM
MPNIITLTGVNIVREANPSGTNSQITATVIDSVTHAPQPGVTVNFTTDTAFATLTPASVPTGSSGTAATTLDYPNPNPGGAPERGGGDYGDGHHSRRGQCVSAR